MTRVAHASTDSERGSLIELLLTKVLYISTTEAAHLQEAGTGAAAVLTSQCRRVTEAAATGSYFEGRCVPSCMLCCNASDDASTRTRAASKWWA